MHQRHVSMYNIYHLHKTLWPPWGSSCPHKTWQILFQRNVLSWLRYHTKWVHYIWNFAVRALWGQGVNLRKSDRDWKPRHIKNDYFSHWGGIISWSLFHHPGTLQTPCPGRLCVCFCVRVCARVFLYMNFRPNVIENHNQRLEDTWRPRLLKAECRIRRRTNGENR